MKRSYRKLPERATVLLLAVMILWGAGCAEISTVFRRQEKKPLYETACTAARQMQLCMEAIKAEKLARGIELAEEDLFATGLLGEDYNFITTTLGDVAAKRTTTDPNMAALVVFLLEEAGLKAGDTLGCCFSGSFPALNIAVLCACDAMGIRAVSLVSCGASTWGANNPEFSYPEMAVLLWEKNLVTSRPVLVSPGGGSDVGRVADPELFAEIWQRAEQLGIPVLMEEDLSVNVEYKKQVLDSYGIQGFIAVGGNISALGNNMVVDLLGQGVIREEIRMVNDGSGLLERYLQENLPCILLLNIRQLLADYGMSFDPASRDAIGESAVYFQTRFNSVPLLFGLLGEIVILTVLWKRKRLQKDDK